MSGNIPPIGRRDLLGLAIVASVAVVPWWPASAQTRRRRLGDRSDRTARQRLARGDEGWRKHPV